MKRPKKITLSNARTSSAQELYVMNTSMNGPRGSKTEIVLDIPMASGRVDSFTLPVTFIPVCVSDLYDAQALLNNTDFARQVQRGNITIVDPDEAREYLDGGDELVEEEKRKLALSPQQRMAESDRSQQDDSNIEAKANPQVIDIVNRTEKEMPKNSKLAALLNIIGVLTKDDLNLISVRMEGPEVTKFLKQAREENGL